MKNRLLSIVLLLTGGLLLMAAVGMPAKSYALLEGSKNDVCSGIALSDSSPCTNTSSSLTSKLSAAINLLSIAVGIIAVVLIIIGGLKFITAGGDASSVASARNTILYAIVGLVVVAFAQVIVRFVLNKVTKK